MFKKFQTRKDIDLLVEEKLYEHVANELEVGEIRKGLWAKASAQASSSSEADVKRKYVELRVGHLQAEGRLAQQFLEEIEANTENEVTPKPDSYREPEPKPEIFEEGSSIPASQWIIGVVIAWALIALIVFSL